MPTIVISQFAKSLSNTEIDKVIITDTAMPAAEIVQHIMESSANKWNEGNAQSNII